MTSRRETLSVFLCGILAGLTFVSLLLSATTDRAMIRVAFAAAAIVEAGTLAVVWLRATK